MKTPAFLSDRKKRFWTLGPLLLALAIGAGYAFQSRWKVGIDPQATLCLSDRVYLVDTKDVRPERGGVFVFLSQGAEPVYEDGTKLAKRMTGLPGDRVEITEEFEMRVNGRKIAQGFWHLRDVDAALIRERFTGSRVLKEDEFWMTGESPKSFDSRYFGPVRRDRIMGRAYGLF